jgi:fructoselysine-6-P-deglycase FrlB-like protein
MIIVQDTFVCKPGNASKLAKIFKEWADVRPKERNTIVMTDMTGQFHRLIVRAQWESLAEYEEEIKNMAENMAPEEKKIMEKFKDMNDMYVSGSREIYKVW